MAVLARGRTIKILLILTVIFVLGQPMVSSGNCDPPTYVGYGGTGTVSGSLHSLTLCNRTFLVDVGAFYGDEGENWPFHRDLCIDGIEAVFITHAHADHVGRLPLLIKEGYSGPVYMTRVTYDLARVMLSASVPYMDMGEETFYYSRHNRDRITPVYLDGYDYGAFEVREENRMYLTARRDQLEAMGYRVHFRLVDQLRDELLQILDKQVIEVEYGELVRFGGECCTTEVELIYVSHIPGSAMVRFDHGGEVFLFTGDIGGYHPFLQETEPLRSEIDWLFVEATYGVSCTDRDCRSGFRRYLGERIEEGHRIIIPSLVMDRSQQILHEISLGIEEGSIPVGVRVYLQSKTASTITAAYTLYSQDRESYSTFFADSFFEGGFSPVAHVRRTPSYLEPGEILIAAPGSVTSGGSLRAVKAYVGDSTTSFIFISYQGPDSIGRPLLAGKESVRIDGVKYTVRADIAYFNSFRGHACLDEILELVGDVSPQRIFIVHSEEDDAHEVAQRYADEFGESSVKVPLFGVAYQ